MNYFLDTSALLAFYYGEPGARRMMEILSDGRSGTGLSVLSAGEFWSSLRAQGWENAFDDEWPRASETVDELVPVTLPVVHRSLDLRRAAPARLPHIDALIAATAAVRGDVLLHCDPHFLSIPARLLKQEYLSA
jgi:predicted nucleic acid-binding protein